MQEFQEPFQLLQPTIGKQALTLKVLKAQAKKLCELTKNPGKTMARDLFMPGTYSWYHMLGEGWREMLPCKGPWTVCQWESRLLILQKSNADNYFFNMVMHIIY